MRRISELMQEIDEEAKRIVKSEMQKVNCDWQNFWVLKEYEEPIKKLLNKAKTWYFICLADEVEGDIEKNGGIEPSWVKVSVAGLKDWEAEEYIEIAKPIKHQTRYTVTAIIHLNTK